MKKIAILMLGFWLGLFMVVEKSYAKQSLALDGLPVQDGGRIKPFSVFAHEYLTLIYGKGTFEGRGATEIIMTWILQPQAWQDRELFELRNLRVKTELGLSTEKKRFTYSELFSNPKLSSIMADLSTKREAKEKLDPYFQAVQRLESQLITFREIAAGRAVKVMPPQAEGGSGSDAWLSLADLEADGQAEFMKIGQSFIAYIGAVTGSVDPGPAVKKLNEEVLNFQSFARAKNTSLYPKESRIDLELHFNSFHPFQKAWMLYLIGALLCLIGWIFSKEWGYRSAWFFVIAGLLLNIYGFALRSYLMERAPVTNMYETVVWVGLGTVLFAIIFEIIYRYRFILFAGAVIGAFCLGLGDIGGDVLDPSLQPLEPVLRDNFWLTVHVMTITISYAAFFLAFGLSDIALFFHYKGSSQHQARLKALTLGIYRSIQVGTGLLAPGIILGGVWADYSWGRFWGWDPKETWALIALLGYMAVMHGRLVGWIKDFALAVTGVLSFSLVIMAWYGVNFVLGAGLHSYGFGAGGIEYVASFVGVHILWVSFVAYKVKVRKSA